MALVLPQSVFFHIGRTGGHWVSYILRRSGLIREQLAPMHIDPIQARLHPSFRQETFSFCFVRHPLQWAASVWCHEMEFGWADPEFASAGNETFSGFLERLLELAPNQPISSHFLRYVDNCDFVGRTEKLADDLHRVLSTANEQFDAAELTLAPFNVSKVAKVTQAARAPRSLLEKVLDQDASYAKRFDYLYIPEVLISDEPVGQVWRGLTLKPDVDLSELYREQEVGFTFFNFDYRFTNGARLVSEGHDRRAQWGLTEALEKVDVKSSCMVIGESDPYFAYLAAEIGWQDTTFVCSSRMLTPQHLKHVMSSTIKVQEFSDTMFRAKTSGSVDLLMLVDALEISPVFENEILAATSFLKPGGTLVFAMPTLNVGRDVSVKTLWPFGSEAKSGRKMAYSTIAYVKELLLTLGFRDVEMVDIFEEKANDRLRPEIERFAKANDCDPETLLNKAIVVATLDKSPHGAAGEHLAQLTSLWLSRVPDTFMKMPSDGLPRAYRMTLSVLKSDLLAETRKRERIEQGLADREAELAKARVDLAVTAVDGDYHRAELLRTREAVKDANRRYDSLLQRVKLLGLVSSELDQ